MEIKKVDRQGRIVIPKEWRESRGMKRIVMMLLEDRVELLPCTDSKLEELDGLICFSARSEIWDWHSLKREILCSYSCRQS